MHEISLCGAWRLRGKHGKTGMDLDLPATVPGCVHTDLLQNGIIDNFFEQDHARALQWIETEDWVYSRTFTCDMPEPDAQLVFEGLDVYCDIYLNGKWVGYSENMFTEHVFAIDGILMRGVNTLEVYFYSPVAMVRGRKQRFAAFTSERLYTRRMQCTYGWDWVERFVTCGIFRPVFLRFGKKKITKDDIYLYTAHADSEWAEMIAEMYFRESCTVRVELSDPSGRMIYGHDFYCEEGVRKERISVEKPLLWYPNGMGAQPLYTFRIWIEGEVVASCTFGIRIAAVAQIPDPPGSKYYEQCRQLQNTESGREYDFNDTFSGFTVYINGKPVWCRGGNWVPCEPFPSAETEQKITSLLEMAAAAHINMIRIWGGGIFEMSHFYQECDRLGILVTQDFMMACGTYPEDEPWFLQQLSREAECAARRLRNHPCLIWWSGDNENAVRGNDQDPDYIGRRAALQAIAPVLQKFDPQRMFLPSSPYGGNQYASKTCGTTHNTQFLEYLLRFIDQGPIENYRNYFKDFCARFIAEEPTMGAISLCSLQKFMSDTDIFGEDPAMWKYHTKTNPCLPKELFDYTELFAERLFGAFRDGADRLFKLQYIQFEWMRLTMELYRRNQGFCSGVIYWMYNECWPAASGWSFVDYYGVPKASYYAFQTAANHVIASFDCRADGMLEIYVANDMLSEIPAKMTLTRIDRNGAVAKTETQCLQIPENCACSVVSVVEEDLIPAEEELLICDLHSEFGEYRTFYHKGILPLKECGDRVRVLSESRQRITVEATSYVHVVAFDAEAVFEDNFFSLLPGEMRTVKINPLCESFDGVKIKIYTIKESQQ